MASSKDDLTQQHDEDGNKSSTMRQKPPLLQSTDLGWNTFNQVNFFRSAATIPSPPVAEAVAAAAASADNHHRRSTLQQQQEETCILETTGGKPSKPSEIFHPTYNQDKDVDINMDLLDIHNERKSKETPSRKYPSILEVPRDEDMSVISNITSSTCLTTNSSSRLDLNKIMGDDPWSPDFLTRRRMNATTQGQQQEKAVMLGNQQKAKKQKIRAVEETIIFFDDDDTTTEDTNSDIDDDIDDYGYYCSSGDGFNGLVSSHLGMGLSCRKEKDNNNINNKISSKSTTATKKSTLFQLPTMEESMDAFFFSLYDILNIDDAVVSACRDDMFEEPIMKPAVVEACQDDEDCFPVKEIRTKTPNCAVPQTKEKIGDERTTELKYIHINHHMKDKDNLTTVKNHNVKRDGSFASKSKNEEISCDSQLEDHTCRIERQKESTVKRTIWNRVQSTLSSRLGIRNATPADTIHLSHQKKNVNEKINIIDESFKTEIVQVDPYREIPPKRQTKMKRIGSSLFAGITNLRQPTQKKQKAKQQKKKFPSLMRSDRQRNNRKTNKKDEQTKEATSSTSNTNNQSRMSKIILSTAGYDNASTTVITIDNTYNTHEIDSESYVTPGGSASSSEFYHHQHHRHRQQYAVKFSMA